MTKPELLALIDRMRQAVEADDSMEARIMYSWESRDSGVDHFGVDAFIRINNSLGQGGAVIVCDGQFLQREDVEDVQD